MTQGMPYSERRGVRKNEDGKKSKAQIMTHLYRSECGMYSEPERELWKYSEQRSGIDILVF